MTSPFHHEKRDEEWRPIAGWDGLYEVSSYGRVKSLPRTVARQRVGQLRIPERILSPARAKRGRYLTVQLHKNGVRTLRSVHALVAEAFIGPRPPERDICHCDGNVANNRPINLRYDTRAGNIADTVAHGRIPRGSSHWNAKLSADLVAKIRGKFKRGVTQASIAREHQISPVTVHNVVRNKTWA